MQLRKGKTKTILESAIDSALLAVEVYNKPRTTFRSDAFIILMVIAWTRMLHAYFYHEIGDKYYYKKKGSNRYELVDGERKAWDLSTCINKYDNLTEAIKKNLFFFIGLRNKIEHRHIEKREIDVLIFGECQAFLLNFENKLIELFGDEYALNESLVYSLQFSHLRTPQQATASKSALSKDLRNIVQYVDNYRSSLTDEVFASQEYSIKLLQIPRISNTNRADLAVEFVRLDELDKKDRQAYENVVTLIKDKTIRIEAINPGRLKPGGVAARVSELVPASDFQINNATDFWRLFAVRPGSGADDPFDTKTEFCHYDEAHGDYVYQDTWPIFIANILQSGRVNLEQVREAVRNGEGWSIGEWRMEG